MNKKYYTYIYLDPRKPGKYVYNSCMFAYEPFYIGKGSGDRYLFHLKENKYNYNKYKNNKIQKILSEGYNLEQYILIIPCNSEQESLNLEIKLIGDIGRHDLKEGPLTNLTDGGEGVSGIVVSKETRKKMSKAHTGEKNHFYGQTHSDETKNKISKVHKGKTPWNKGKINVYSDETRKKMSKPKTEEHKRKISKSAKKRVYNNTCNNCNKTFESKTWNKKYCKECIKKHLDNGYSEQMALIRLNNNKIDTHRETCVVFENEVYVIKGLLKHTSLSIKNISIIFNVSYKVIWKIKNNKTWKHVIL